MSPLIGAPPHPAPRAWPHPAAWRARLDRLSRCSSEALPVTTVAGVGWAGSLSHLGLGRSL